MTAASSTTPTSIADAFAAAKEEGRPALIPYVMAGYPDHDQAIAIGEALVRGGADLLEVGMPFSDPLADGPTIQRAATASLAGGTTIAACLETVRELRRRVDVPIVLMGYLNPLLRYGLERFCTDAASAGANGTIVADMPPEESQEFVACSRAAGLDVVFLVAPTSPDERIAQVSAAGSGFLYAVSLTGVTGARGDLAATLPEFLDRVRANSRLPVAVGFGISTPEHVRIVGEHADGAVFASGLIDLLDGLPVAGRSAAAEAYVRSMREG